MKSTVTYLFIFFFLVVHHANAQEQSVSKGDVALNVNIGVPHLFKGITKLTLKSDAFKNNFSGYIDIGPITGLNPFLVKGEYTFNKWLALGLNYGLWNIKFDVTDHYNVQRQQVGALVQDSVDIYKVSISSKSIGIRPIIHFNLKSKKNNFYLAFAMGFTSTKIGIGFSSTDAGRTLGAASFLLSQSLSIPGTMYIAPTLGYRHYFNNWLGLNFEAGYDKGALLLAGLALRFNTLNKSN